MKFNSHVKYILIITILLLVIIWMRKCGPGRTIKMVTKTDTVRVTFRDTVYKTKQIPYTIVYRDTLLRFIDDTLYIVEPVDTAQILTDYFARRYYIDTSQVKGGLVIIYDTVSENRIMGRSLYFTGKETIVTNTITGYKEYPNRLRLLGGFQVFGNKTNPLAGIGGSILLQTRDYKSFTAGVSFIHGYGYYQAGYFAPIWKRK